MTTNPITKLDISPYNMSNKQHKKNHFVFGLTFTNNINIVH